MSTESLRRRLEVEYTATGRYSWSRKELQSQFSDSLIEELINSGFLCRNMRGEVLLASQVPGTVLYALTH